MKYIKVLGSEMCSTCTTLKNRIQKIVDDKSLDAKVEKVTDIAKVMSYGVMSTPALVINDKVMCSGRVPSDKEIMEWIS